MKRPSAEEDDHRLTRSVLEVYQSYIWQSPETRLAELLYDRPPVTLREAATNTEVLMQRYMATGWFSEDRISRVKQALYRINRELGGLTVGVKNNIERLYEGVVEAGHQPVCMGGPTYILNKAATVAIISKIAANDNTTMAPLFFVADYDGVQPELTNIRTPLLGPDGNLIHVPVPSGYEHSPASEIPLTYDWYVNVEESIRAGYTPLFNSLKGTVRDLFEERLEHALSITRASFIQSTTLGQWAAGIMSHLFNVEADLGIPLLMASDSEMRELFQSGMETLLARSNRETMLKTHRLVTDSIVNEGLEPGMGYRHDDYVPFLYECPESECHGARFELHYQVNSTVELTGQCPSCGQHTSIEVDATDPDLSDVIQYLSPRVDTRQFIVDTVIPVVRHVGGTGETAYYAQIIPLARELGIPFPQFVKYPRVYFNTPWNEQLAQRLRDRVPVLHTSELFKLIGQVTRLREERDITDINSYVMQLGMLIDSRHDALVAAYEEVKERLQKRVNPEDLQLKFDIECYLSWVYGEYERKRSSQESTWSWIEWAINAGLSDLFGPYHRMYHPALRNGATLFVNFMV